MSDYLPLQLNYGLLMLYNIHGQRSVSHGFVAPKGFNWGTIYQISPYGIPQWRTVGQKVLFSGGDEVCVLAFHGTQYPIVPEVRLVTTELDNNNLA
jgi:hypothetical protein